MSSSNADGIEQRHDWWAQVWTGTYIILLMLSLFSLPPFLSNIHTHTHGHTHTYIHSYTLPREMHNVLFWWSKNNILCLSGVWGDSLCVVVTMWRMQMETWHTRTHTHTDAHTHTPPTHAADWLLFCEASQSGNQEVSDSYNYHSAYTHARAHTHTHTYI